MKKYTLELELLNSETRQMTATDGTNYELEVKLFKTTIDDSDGVIELSASADAWKSWIEMFGALDGKVTGDVYQADNGHFKLFESANYITNDFKKRAGLSMIADIADYGTSVGIVFSDGTATRKSYARKLVVDGQEHYYPDFAKKARILANLRVTKFEDALGREYLYDVKEFNGNKYLEIRVAE